MGADLILTYLTWPIDSKLNWNAGLKTLNKYCKDYQDKGGSRGGS